MSHKSRPVHERIASLVSANWNTQKEAALALGIKPQYLNDIIKGRRLVSVPFALSLGRSLDREAMAWTLLHDQLREKYDEERAK